jgi:ferric-dicitrate binding protein FerR (iron transport regulator)
MTRNEKIGRLLFRYTRGELTDREKRELSTWRAASLENEQAFIEETDPENMRKNYIRMQASQEAVLQRLEIQDPKIWTVQSRAPVFRLTFFRTAAAVVLIVALYFVFQGTGSNKRYEAVFVGAGGIETALNDFQRGMGDGYRHIKIRKTPSGALEFVPPDDSVSAPGDTHRMYTLPERYFNINLRHGIEIRLNQMSSVTYPVNLFQDTIRLAVYGETYYEVNRKLGHPLVLLAKNIQIDLTRGKLDLNAYSDSLFTKVTLLNGSAIIYFNNEKFELEAGQQAVIGQTIYHIERPASLKPLINWIN